MPDDTLQHIYLESIADYTAALDTVCALAKRNLYLFEKDYDNLGFNSELRYETLRRFLLDNLANRLLVLAHDTYYLSTRCPRMSMLLRQFDDRLLIHQTRTLHCTAPFCVADNTHYVRRYHFDDPRGLLAINDPKYARPLTSSYLEMWADSHTGVSTGKLGL